MSLKQTLEKITSKRVEAAQSSRKRKLLLRAAGAFVLLLMALYFVRQFNALRKERQVGITPPSRYERLDTTKSKPAVLTRLYEQEEKNRYRDSLAWIKEEKALDYIVMDWENLYDVRKKEALSQPPAESQAPDSLAALLRPFSGRDATGQAGPTAKPERKLVTNRMYGKSARSRIGKRTQKAKKQEAYEATPADPFNTVRAADYPTATHPASPDTVPRSSPASVGNGYSAPAPAATGRLIPAVVHGEWKVKPGSKVTFRTLEDGYADGRMLPRNILLTAIADFTQGRMTFSNFRAKMTGSRDDLAGVSLSLNCYDSDLMAGISFQDQSPVAAELGRGTVNSLSNAVGDLSSNILPFGSLARASSNLARGAIRGAARSRQQFIYLSDGYRVFLEPGPLKP